MGFNSGFKGLIKDHKLIKIDPIHRPTKQWMCNVNSNNERSRESWTTTDYNPICRM